MTQIGYWPDPPSRRWGWDADGTIALFISPDLSSVSEISALNRQSMNDESISGYVSAPYTHWKLCFLFPEKRNLTHYYAAAQKTYHYATLSGTTVEWSNDTTNGMDGNWTAVASSWNLNSDNGNGATYPDSTPGFPDMRTGLEALPIAGVKAIRFSTSGYFLSTDRVYTMHLYGHKAAGEAPHRLDFAYEDGSELVQDFDYGDQARGSIYTWSPSDTFNIGSALYLRNRSPDKVATDVTVLMQNLTSDMINRLTISKDNISYGSQITYAEIQPLEVVGPIYLKSNLPDTTTLGLYTSRLKTTVGTWV
jgi:hypothetical protein